jgi:hypothetical protein
MHHPCTTPKSNSRSEVFGFRSVGVGSAQLRIGRLPIGRLPIGRLPIGRLPIGRLPIGRLPIGPASDRPSVGSAQLSR